MVGNVTDGSFEEEVTKSKMPVLVDFWAEWCGPCRMLVPILDDLSEKLKDKIKILKMNIEENPETPTKYGIRSIPTMILFSDGKQLGTKVGANSKEAIEKWINELI